MEFFKIRSDIPFMRHALLFNIISLATFIIAVALLVFGSGAVRGFAVVHCLGILTSIFSAVFFSSGIVNLWYGRQKKLGKVSIGQVWKPT